MISYRIGDVVVFKDTDCASIVPGTRGTLAASFMNGMWLVRLRGGFSIIVAEHEIKWAGSDAGHPEPVARKLP